MSAVKHADAKAQCITDFFSGDGTSSEGDTLCNIFAWVDIGIMGGLWVILAIFHVGQSFSFYDWRLISIADLSIHCDFVLWCRPKA